MASVAVYDPLASGSRWQRHRASTIVYGILVVFALIWLAPLAVVLANSFRSMDDITRSGVLGFPHAIALDHWHKAWATTCIGGTCQGISPFFWNSFQMVVPATIISTAIGALNGYALSKWRFAGSGILFGIITLGVFLPGQMVLLPWAITLGTLGLTNTTSGLVLVHVVQGLSFTTLFCRNYYVNVPEDLIKAARIDGAGFYRIFWRIVLPLSPPILIVCVIWQFTNIWNEFLFAVTFSSGASQPITPALIALAGSGTQARQYNIESAAVLMAALPPLLVYLVGGKYFMRGLTQGAVK